MIPSNFSAIAILAVLVLALSGIYLRFKTRIAARYSRPLAIFLIVSLVTAGGSIVSAQVAPPTPFPGGDIIITSLPAPNDPDANPPLFTAVTVPTPTNLGEFVVAGQEEKGLLQLGKSLFWDSQLGSDGVQSCASCHFNAGADSRSKNQLSPGLRAVPPDITFGASNNAPSNNAPNYQLTAADFPFHRLRDPNQPPSATNEVVFDTNDVTSSQGVFNTTLVRTNQGQAADQTISEKDLNGFVVNGINVRRSEPRNTPTVISAIFNKLQFWDGRAKETFNGVDTKGVSNPNIPIFKALGKTQLIQYPVALDNSSMASLVTEPPLSENELSAAGRTLPEVGAKFLRKRGQALKSLRPLGQQLVSLSDSVLGGTLSRFPRTGLTIGAYDRLIRQAFKPEFWRSWAIIEAQETGPPVILSTMLPNPTDSEETVVLPPNQFSLRDWNFSLFAGLAMQKYISTLVPNQTPFDKFQAGDATALTEQQKKGLALFVGATNGSVPLNSPTPGTPGNTGANCNTCHTIPEFTRASVRRAAITASPTFISVANGFFTNYGVRPAANDPGAGSATGSIFKTPTLRNIGLTAPYMHNGGMATLEQVVQFYNRGRSDENSPPPDAPQQQPQPVFRGPQLGLDPTEQVQLVDFLRNGLTDKRVLLEQAPFDHPELLIPNGHQSNQFSVTPSGNTNGFPQATDDLLRIPQVGKNGITTAQKKFLE